MVKCTGRKIKILKFEFLKPRRCIYELIKYLNFECLKTTFYSVENFIVVLLMFKNSRNLIRPLKRLRNLCFSK